MYLGLVNGDSFVWCCHSVVDHGYHDASDVKSHQTPGLQVVTVARWHYRKASYSLALDVSKGHCVLQFSHPPNPPPPSVFLCLEPSQSCEPRKSPELQDVESAKGTHSLTMFQILLSGQRVCLRGPRAVTATQLRNAGWLLVGNGLGSSPCDPQHVSNEARLSGLRVQLAHMPFD